MSMKILRKNPELRGGGSNSFVRRFLTAYTLSEIVIVMLIISVVVAVTIGITKRKLESTVSYTYYSAYETLKDVSRSLLTDFNPKNEKYQASLPDNLVNSALQNNPYENLLQTIWIQPANAYGVNTNPGIVDGTIGDGPGGNCSYGITCPPGQVVDPATCSCVTSIDSPCPIKSCPVGFYLSNGHMKGCMCKPNSGPTTTDNCTAEQRTACSKSGGTFNPTTCECQLKLPDFDIDPCLTLTCQEGYTKLKNSVTGECSCVPGPFGQLACQITECPAGEHLVDADKSTCKCVPDDNGGDDPGTGGDDGSDDDPVAVCQPGDTPPECGQQCVDGQWQAIPGFTKDCAEYTEEWHDLPECKCMPVARTLPRTGANFCALFEERVNTNAGDCTGSTISSTTTNFSDKTPDFVLRNGIRIYNLHSDPVRLDELAGNKTGFTISFDDNASASANSDFRVASNKTQYLAMQNETLNMFIRKPLSFFPLLSGLFEQKAYATCVTTCKDYQCRYYELKCDDGEQPELIDLVPNAVRDELPDLNESQMGNNHLNDAAVYCFDHDTSQCEGKGGKVIVPGCKCYIPAKPSLDDNPPLVARPYCPYALTGCPEGEHLVDADKASCKCVADEEPETCAITRCDDGEHLVDGDKSSCHCVPDEDPGAGETPPVTPDPDDNLPKVDTGEYGYIVYVDIDGAKGSSTLWEDVYPFYITLSGQVVPAFHSSDGDNFGGNSDEYLQTSIQYEKINANGRRSITWLDKSVSFKEGACGSGYINSSTPYCSGVSEHAECSSNVSGSKCTLKTVKPVKFF